MNAGNLVQVLDGTWKILNDPQNQGKAGRWWEHFPIANARDATIPGTIQQIYPGYHGVAWYCLDFTTSIKPFPTGRVLVWFGAVDYFTEVWLNGKAIGQHEGGETPFWLDCTEALAWHGPNQLVVRVVNPSNEAIDGFTLKAIPHRNKAVPYVTGYDFNFGGVLQSVALIMVPNPWIEDVAVVSADLAGNVALDIKLRCNNPQENDGQLELSVANQHDGFPVFNARIPVQSLENQQRVVVHFKVDHPRPWSLDDPQLYMCRVQYIPKSGTTDNAEFQVRFGFREFCVRDGYFHLNGKRVFLKSAHTGNCFPIGLHRPVDPGLMRKDLYTAKTLGFNAIRFIAGVAYPEQLDACDELGLLVYEENLAAWMLEDSPDMQRRFDSALEAMITRDRNHPSVVIWGLLNENPDDPVFKHAAGLLPLIRKLDPSRLVLLNSGRWDKHLSIGSASNPGSNAWEFMWGAESPGAPDAKDLIGGYVPGMGDAHYYPPIPLRGKEIDFFRTIGQGVKPVFLSEHGAGSEFNAPRLVQLYEQAGVPQDLEDVQVCLKEKEAFFVDWNKWHMDELFPDIESFFKESYRRQAEHRLIALDLIRSNPRICGHNVTGLVDQGMSGEGCMSNMFRELKAGATDAMASGWASLRFCTFIEPFAGYRGTSFKLEVVLANEDVLRPGTYTVRVNVHGPGGWIFERATSITIPDTAKVPRDGFALPIFNGSILINGPAGIYDVVATFDHGAAPTGGHAQFQVVDPVDLPRIDHEIVLWDNGEILEPWLASHSVRTRPFAAVKDDAGIRGKRAVILVGGLKGNLGNRNQWSKLLDFIARGCVVIFATTKALMYNMDPLYWIPLEINGMLSKTATWAPGRDDFAKKHPIFAGLPTGLLDIRTYRDLVSEFTIDSQEETCDVISGAFGVGYYPTRDKSGYYSGIHIAIYPFFAGSFILNTFSLLDHLESDPTAGRMLLNILRFAEQGIDMPTAELPPDYAVKTRDLYP
nr:glycoside hydrolase family 2 TIM barrel-domain containing protein [Candidatus Sigynarchaeota archaeon]